MSSYDHTLIPTLQHEQNKIVLKLKIDPEYQRFVGVKQSIFIFCYSNIKLKFQCKAKFNVCK